MAECVDRYYGSHIKVVAAVVGVVELASAASDEDARHGCSRGGGVARQAETRSRRTPRSATASKDWSEVMESRGTKLWSQWRS
ncbi:hypothetical protein GUJ93_ZPchr0010g10902 [Zizania palustris]|uniref:Uncharacterized protein n=1 Tax=Zizania palustris TaxID=103762 RepID=A0A8J5W855_ZIZPA|nr:hypothetical protein GUJ93_ZPchr0010g10902 [Zizania palustris]